MAPLRRPLVKNGALSVSFAILGVSIVILTCFDSLLSSSRFGVKNYSKKAVRISSVGKRSRVCKAESSVVGKADEFRTPHSGYHKPTIPTERFFEGWYFRVTIPEKRKSFAFIYSIEDPNNPLSNISSMGVQVMGPKDGYAVQYSRNIDNFWADTRSLALGNVFQYQPLKPPGSAEVLGMRSFEDFKSTVKYGFQTNATHNQGHIRAIGLTPPGDISESVTECKWEYKMKPTQGWGKSGQPQESTAGWLSALPVFEPHWQVLMADGRADGWIEWGDERYDFTDAPVYAEKNWGQSFPSKWFWIQCNAFKTESDELLDVSLTSVGALRKIPSLNTEQEEAVGLIAVHYNGKFIAFEPKDSSVSWNVDPWGLWNISAKSLSSDLRAEVSATVRPDSGTPLRAPTAGLGLAPVCKDSFYGDVSLKIYNGSDLLLHATSQDGGVEIGGGPWEKSWVDTAELSPVIRTLAGLPVDPDKVFKGPFERLRPLGL